MFTIPRELQKIVLLHLNLSEQRFVGRYMLVSKAWHAWTREINGGFGMLRAHLDCIPQAEDVVNVDLDVRCRCRSCAEHVNCSTSVVVVDMTLYRAVPTVKGSFCGLAVTLDSTAAAIWLDCDLTSDKVVELLEKLRCLKTTATKLGMVVLAEIDIGATAVKLNQLVGTDLKQIRDLKDLWHPVVL